MLPTNKTSVMREFDELSHEYTISGGWVTSTKDEGIHVEIDLIKSFLSTSLDSLLSTLEAEVEKKTQMCDCVEFGSKGTHVSGKYCPGKWYLGYNSALSDILALINKAKE